MSVAGRSSIDRLSSTGGSSRPVAAHLVLDVGDRLLGGLGATVHHLPARALRQVAPHHQDDQAEHRSDEEADPPGDGQAQRVEQDERAERAEDRAGPVGAVHRDVHPAPVAGRDQLVDGRVDGRVLTADAHSGDEPGRVEEQHPAGPVAQRQRGDAAADQVDAEGDHEQVAPPEPVGQPAEPERADHLAGQVHGGQRPTAAEDMASVSGLVSVSATALATVISSPSRIQATPSATTIRVWKGDQGSRSMRAGMRLRIEPCVSAGCATACLLRKPATTPGPPFHILRPESVECTRKQFSPGRNGVIRTIRIIVQNELYRTFFLTQSGICQGICGSTRPVSSRVFRLDSTADQPPAAIRRSASSARSSWVTVNRTMSP